MAAFDREARAWRRGTARLSSCLLLCLLVLSFLLSPCIGAKIFLSSDSATPWSGDCSVATCTRSQPCGSDLAYAVPPGSDCDLVFLSGVYSKFVQITGNTTNQRLSIGLGDSVSALELQASIMGFINVSHYPELQSSSVRSVFSNNSGLDLTSSLQSVQMQDVSFEGESWFFAAASSSSSVLVNITNCYFSSVPSMSKNPISIVSQNLYMGHCTVNTPDKRAINTQNIQPASYFFDHCSFIVPRGLLLDGSNGAQVFLTDCTIDATGSPINALSVLDTSYATLVVVTRCVLSATSGPYASTLLPATMYASQSTLKMVDSTVVGMHMELISTAFNVSHCEFYDSYVAARTSFHWVDMVVHQNSYMDHVDVYSNGYLENFELSNPTNNPNVTFRALQTLRIDSRTRFVVPKFQIYGSAFVTVGQLEVTDAIVGSASSQLLFYSLAPAGSHWNFHSINITDTTVNFVDLPLLVYTPSNATKGITLENTGLTYNNTLPLRKVAIAWPSTSSPPIFLQEYPIMRGPSLATTLTIPTQVWSSPDYVFTVSSLNPPLISFRSLYSGPPKTTCTDPPPGFVCSAAGTLYAPDSISEESITIPSGTGTVGVFGNITVNSTITFIGTDSSIVSTGCVIAPGGIAIQVEKGNPIPSGPITLVTQSSECDPLTFGVSLKSDSKDCRKVKVTKDPSAPSNTMTVLFEVSNIGCNTKWIILGSVLGGVVLILLVLALVFTFNSKARAWVRPFSTKNQQKTPNL